MPARDVSVSGSRCLLLGIVAQAVKDASSKATTDPAKMNRDDAKDWLANGPGRRVADLLGFESGRFAPLADK